MVKDKSYYTKEECFKDVLASLRANIIDEVELGMIMSYYEELEYYECCSGIKEAYEYYKQEEK
jgi:hypothetical protein